MSIDLADVLHALDRALEGLRLSNSIETSGTPTDTVERGAILALGVLRDSLADLEP